MVGFSGVDYWSLTQKMIYCPSGAGMLSAPIRKLFFSILCQTLIQLSNSVPSVLMAFDGDRESPELAELVNLTRNAIKMCTFLLSTGVQPSHAALLRSCSLFGSFVVHIVTRSLEHTRIWCVLRNLLPHLATVRPNPEARCLLCLEQGRPVVHTPRHSFRRTVSLTGTRAKRRSQALWSSCSNRNS